MERKIDNLIRALVESFDLHARPCRHEAELDRAWYDAKCQIELVVSGGATDLTASLRAIVRACRVLGAVEPQAYAAAVAGALGLDVGPAFEVERCDCAA